MCDAACDAMTRTLRLENRLTRRPLLVKNGGDDGDVDEVDGRLCLTHPRLSRRGCGWMGEGEAVGWTLKRPCGGGLKSCRLCPALSRTSARARAAPLGPVG
eukprot:5912076-Pleurochrysis_carterae.AAC.1